MVAAATSETPKTVLVEVDGLSRTVEAAAADTADMAAAAMSTAPVAVAVAATLEEAADVAAEAEAVSFGRTE